MPSITSIRQYSMERGLPTPKPPPSRIRLTQVWLLNALFHLAGRRDQAVNSYQYVAFFNCFPLDVHSSGLSFLDFRLFFAWFSLGDPSGAKGSSRIDDKGHKFVFVPTLLCGETTILERDIRLRYSWGDLERDTHLRYSWGARHATRHAPQ